MESILKTASTELTFTLRLSLYAKKYGDKLAWIDFECFEDVKTDEENK